MSMSSRLSTEVTHILQVGRPFVNHGKHFQSHESARKPDDKGMILIKWLYLMTNTGPGSGIDMHVKLIVGLCP